MRLVSLAALASALLVTAPVLAAPATIAPLSFTERTLPNGLRVFAMPDASGTSVSVQVWYDVGGRDDPRGRSGFAHLFEHLMFKATRNMPAETMDRLTEDVGGNNNASTDDDFTEYHEVAPANHLERLIWAEAERMGALVIDQPTFLAERDVVKEELRGDAARPYDSLFRLNLPAASYAVSSYARSPIGSIADLDAATVEDVRAFHAQYYRPDNAVLVVSGNFNPADLNRWVDKYFGAVARPSWAIPHNFVNEPARAAGRRYTLHAPNTPLPAVILSWQLPPATDPDHAVINVLDGILSGGESARFYQSLVYRDQVAAEAGVSADLRKGPGMFSAYAIVAGGKTAEAVEAALRREIALVRDKPVAAAELTRVKNQIVTSALKERETAEGRASTLASSVIIERDPHAADKRIAQIQAVTAADVQRVARKLLADNGAVTITYLPAAPGAAADALPVAATVATTPLVAPPQVPVVVAASADARVQPPAPGAPVTPVLPVPVERRLANGMRLVVIERHALPIVTAYMVAGGGSSTDPVGRGGVAELTADLLTKGTATRSATDIVREVETLGGAIGGDAVRDGMFLSLTVKSDQLTPAMNVFADVAMHPSFKPEELERERSQALDGLKVAYSEPGQLASMVSSRAVYGLGPYGRPANGTPASLGAIRRDDVVAGYGIHWRPDTTTLVMAGDISPDQAQQVAERLFGGWAKPNTPPAPPPAPGAPAAPSTLVIDMPQSPQAAVVLARVTIARNDPRYYPMVVAEQALGGGYSARLNQEIRVKRGLAYGAGSSFQARRAPGPLAASTQTKNETVPDVIDLINSQMTLMGSELVPTAELDARKATLIGAFGRQVETTDGLAGYAAGLVLEDVPLAEIARYSAAVNAVTPDQVRSVSQELIDPKPASVIVVGDAAQFLPKLQAKGVKADVIPLSKLNLDSPTLQ
ncbi:M16 family metallopeptidase [Sphingomonas crusticola]|uniref:M16 family metallopeptidase n=1 Tax=Sphingomonas crusticola TaxID=1697973 RepID=UPI000E23A8CD|nr:pitrilysin family protein [Sphingomonas crusticola]